MAEPAALLDALAESSLDALALKAELGELQREHSVLQSRVESLSAGNNKLHDELNTMRYARSLGRPSPSYPYDKQSAASAYAQDWRDRSSQPQPTPSSSRALGTLGTPTKTSLPAAHTPATPDPKGKLVMRTMDEVDDDDFVFATRIQLEWQTDTDADADTTADASDRLAAEKQQEYEEEDRRLRAQMQSLQAAVPSTFNCGVCLDEVSEFMVARIEPCGHEFCRNCLRGYIRSKLGEHRFPILCPECSIDKDKNDPGSTLLCLNDCQ